MDDFSIAGEKTPEFGLPFFFVAFLNSPLPVQDHLRAEDEIGIEELGDFSRQLIAFEPLGIIVQIGGQRLETRARRANRQQLHNPPGRKFRVINPLLVPSRQNGLKNIRDHAPGKGELHIGANPMKSGQLHGNPTFHALALDNDDLRSKRRNRRFAQNIGQPLRKDFHAVAHK
ncbi:MAG: hypothetical protein A4E66_01774 [Syntrophus sp. PtaB.Bin001]|nr:MAG: hypothetical protein A4E66_01774 [Syntrophus sp. PtaB.Bin001]OPY91540.1 MAG: hypothetical protein A4E72_00094 [Syntrophus sp. PtaU1.Bin208]